MILALIVLMLALLGWIPAIVAIPVSLASLCIAAGGGIALQRQLMKLPRINGCDQMIGATATATTSISPKGQVQWANELWAAQSLGTPIERGQRVLILRIDGLTATVEPVPC